MKKPIIEEELFEDHLDPMQDYEELLEDDEISPAEAGFMRGWGEV